MFKKTKQKQNKALFSNKKREKNSSKKEAGDRKHIKIMLRTLLQLSGDDHIKQPALQSTAGKPKLLLKLFTATHLLLCTLLEGI